MALKDDFAVFDDLLKTVEQSKEFLAKLDTSIKRAKEIEAELLSNLWRTNQYQAVKDDNVLNTTVFDAAFKETKESAPGILVNQIENAANMAPEYEDKILLGPLIRAADSQKNFSFRRHKAGLKSWLEVSINMDSTAGNIEEWANAVKAVRDMYGTAGRSPARASNYWRFRVYHRSWDGGSYEETIRDRFAGIDHLAPYWSLLNNGNAGAKMSSDWGGTPYPTSGPTHFVEKAEEQIEDLFRTLFFEMSTSTAYELEEDPFIRTQLDRLRDYINKMEKLVPQTGEVDFTTPAIKRLNDYYEAQDRAIDKEKLRKAVLDAIQNPTKQRFELTLSGTKRTRIRRKKLLTYVYGG